MVRDTSAMPTGLRLSVPLKITSAISPPRRALADCSPSTQRIASETLDLPHPLGPTIAVTPGWKFSEVLSANDLKPKTVKFLRYMMSKLRFRVQRIPDSPLNVKKKIQHKGASFSRATTNWVRNQIRVVSSGRHSCRLH